MILLSLLATRVLAVLAFLKFLVCIEQTDWVTADGLRNQALTLKFRLLSIKSTSFRFLLESRRASRRARSRERTSPNARAGDLKPTPEGLGGGLAELGGALLRASVS